MKGIEELVRDKPAMSKWVTTKDSYFSRVKAQHEKWFAQHQLWMYWFEFLNNEKSTLSDAPDIEIYDILADQFEKRFHTVLDTDLTTRFDDICESYADFDRTFKVS